MVRKNLKQFIATKSEFVDKLKLTDVEWFQLLGGHISEDGEVQFPFDSSGKVTEVSAAAALIKLGTIDTDTGSIASSNTWMNDAVRNLRDNAKPDGGNFGGTAPFHDNVPVVVLADGAGAIGAVIEVDPAVAAKDVISEWTLQVDTTGLYKLDFIENTGAPAVPIPDYNTAPVSIQMVAGYPYVIGIMTTNTAVNLGVNAMANTSFPNAATMIITSKSRSE